jgi:hypothetical protein
MMYCTTTSTRRKRGITSVAVIIIIMIHCLDILVCRVRAVTTGNSYRERTVAGVSFDLSDSKKVKP